MIRSWRFIFIAVISSMTIIIPQSHSSLLETLDKQFILNIHNQMRSQIASGANGLSPVSNMQALDWNVKLENKSFHLQSRCQRRKSFEIILSDGIPYLLLKYKNLENTKVLNISNILQSTFDKLNVTSKKKCKGTTKCRMRNQILEPTISSLGCTLFQCTPTNIVLTCAYNKESSILGHLNPFNIGQPCSNCPNDFSYCLNRSLCATESQCHKTSEKQCKCLVKKDACLINGVFVENRCQCICNSGFKGINCQVSTSQCLDQFWQCQEWARNELCFMKTVRSICENSCTRCKPESHRSATTKATKRECLDKRSECQMWKEKRYCFIKTVRFHCPYSCSSCNDPHQSEQSSPITSKPPSLSSSLTSFSSMSAEPISCKIRRDLCINPGFRAVCKRTCETITSREFQLSSSSIPPIYSKVPEQLDPETQSSIEPSSCLAMSHLCNNPSVKAICKKTCSLSSTSALSKTNSPISSTSSTISVEPVNCSIMKDICSNPNIRELCKKTCGTITTPRSFTPRVSLSSTYSTISTEGSTVEPTTCPMIKSLCNRAEVREMCKKTCARDTHSVSSIPLDTPTISILKLASSVPSTSPRYHISSSTISFPGEPAICKNIKENCTNPTVRLLCKSTCESTLGTFPSSTSEPSKLQTFKSVPQSTTLPSSIEPPICPQVKNKCTDQRIKELCKKTCGTTTSPSPGSSKSSMRLSSGRSDPATSITTELSICPNMKHLCGQRSFNMLCRKTCATTTTPLPYSQSSSLSTQSKPLPSEPEICRNLAQYCLDPNIKKQCSLTCSTSTASQRPSGSPDGNGKNFKTTCKPRVDSTESPLCKQMSTYCNNPGFQKVCPITCDECAPKALPHRSVYQTRYHKF